MWRTILYISYNQYKLEYICHCLFGLPTRKTNFQIFISKSSSGGGGGPEIYIREKQL
jgi:hypothetical protein